MLTPVAFKKPVEYIGTAEQEDEIEFPEDQDGEDEELYGVFDEENPEGELQQEEQPAYRIITQTFEGTEIPAGAIPENATDIEITTVTE